MIDNFAKLCIENGGDITPLLIDSQNTNGTGLTNCSIFSDDDRLYVNLRHVEYTLYHSEKVKFAHPWGPVVYVHPEDDWKLRTNNFLGVINDNLDDFNFYSKVDTSQLDQTPLWDFVGLEDARVVKWNNKLYLSGVRRDTTTNGEGRMELSEVVLQSDNTFKEISRERIPIPIPGPSYCEKNWMPIIDMPYHYVKWCNPTEVVKYDPETNTSETVFLGSNLMDIKFDFRGGSQVIPYKDKYRIALCHVTNLFKSESGRKNCTYRHRFIIWDDEWNVVSYTDEFDFVGGHVEFSCGACFHKDKFLITFGFQDNTSFLLTVTPEYLEKFLGV